MAVSVIHQHGAHPGQALDQLDERSGEVALRQPLLEDLPEGKGKETHGNVGVHPSNWSIDK